MIHIEKILMTTYYILTHENFCWNSRMVIDIERSIQSGLDHQD